MKNPCILIAVVKRTRSIGASEDLVTEVAENLASQNSAPAFWFNFPPPENDNRIMRLRKAGCRIYFANSRDTLFRIKRRLRLIHPNHFIRTSLNQTIRAIAPSRVLVNQGGNSDASIECAELQRLGVAYDVLCHSATANSWPSAEFLPWMRSIFTKADRSFFVSKDIADLTAVQIGTPLEKANVVYNPVKFSDIQNVPMETREDRLNLACVARLSCKVKGQDLILRVLALPKWRKRPVQVTFYGDGPDRKPLEGYAKALGLKSVHFAGHVSDIRSIWHKNHFIIQPSRFEGYGLSLVEAMFCQRAAIATAFPAAMEFIRDGETGFLARGSSIQELDIAMERAWQERCNWEAMGQAAADLVISDYPKDPVGDFTRRLLGVEQ